MSRLSVKPLDAAAIVLAALLFAGSVGFTVDRSTGRRMVDIKGASNEWLYPLTSEKVVAVSGSRICPSASGSGA